ncbi:MAG: efflux RND transporter periplasmic adaptor subunit [Nitrospira sp.]|nr:efflux RND transporter periplasmic adaptor subunit [Nitrospira sp.]
MNQDMRRKSLIVGVAVAGLFVGAIAGFFAAHRMMSDVSGMKSSGEMKAHGMEDMKSMAGMGDMKEMPMEGAKPMKGMETMSGMSGAPTGAVAVPAVARQLIGVRSASAAHATLEEEIRTVGTVGYDERGFAQVTLKISGWVRKVFVDSIGRPVRKGEPLFTVYSPDLMATQDEYLLAIKTQAQLAESPLDDAKANADALVASARERLRLWDVTDAQIAALERRGKAEPVLTIYAPSSGIVMKREALPGKYVEPGTTLYEIADLSMVWISADIYESEMAVTKVGQPASITFATYPEETFRGTIAYVYPTLNTEARTVRVRLELPNPELKLKPGMYGNVILQTNVVRTLVVPKEAVLNTGLRQLVFMDRGQGRYEPTLVKLGRRSQDAVEVMEGLKEGDRIVTSGTFLLDAESKLASASSMQSMMGRIGMGDWQMRGAYEAKMEEMSGMQGMSGMKSMGGMSGREMEGMQGMKGMEGMKGIEDMPGMKGMSGMPGMDSGSAKAISETRKVAGYTLTFTTLPETPKAGEVLLRLKLTDQTGKPVTNAQVLFVYTMPMPGMTDSKVTARHTEDGLYEGKVMFGMGGTWIVTVNVTIPGQPPVIEKFQFLVAGGGM